MGYPTIIQSREISPLAPVYLVIRLRECHHIHSGLRADGSWDCLQMVEKIWLRLAYYVITCRDL